MEVGLSIFVAGVFDVVATTGRGGGYFDDSVVLKFTLKELSDSVFKIR